MIQNPGLYYPYIHFRDVEWVKASLLWFGQLRRIVPADYALNDSPEIRQMREAVGPDGQPLIVEEPPAVGSVLDAERRLLNRLTQQPPDFLKRFQRKEAKKEFGDDQLFQMHRGKMYPLLEFLKERDLAWPAEGLRARAPEQWLSVHPRLGETIMSVIAIAIATQKGLDIVTQSGELHRALAEQNEEGAVHRLFDGYEGPPSSFGNDVLKNELGMAVLLTALDVRKLSIPQICELVREGKDLGRFKARLEEAVRGARFFPDMRERANRIGDAAGEIIDEWKKHRKALPRYAVEALVPLTEAKIPTAVTTSLAGATTILTLGMGAGLAIAFAVYTGTNAWVSFKAKQNHPLNYLSKIQRTLDVIATRA